MGAVYPAMRLQSFQVFSDSDLGGAEMFGQCTDQHTPVAI
jgi:hypothetical protein